MRRVEVNDERMQLIAGSWLRPDRGNKAPGMTDDLPCSCAQHMKSPVASSLAAQPALPEAVLETGNAQGAGEPPKRPQKAPCMVTSPSVLRHVAWAEAWPHGHSSQLSIGHGQQKTSKARQSPAPQRGFAAL